MSDTTEPDKIAIGKMMEDHPEAAPTPPRQHRRDYSGESLAKMTPKSFQAMEHNLSQEAFPIIPNHEAFGREFCPMCGTEVDAKGDPTHDGNTGTDRNVDTLLKRLGDLAEADPRLPGLLLLRTRHPNESIRKLCPRFKLGKSQMADLMTLMVKHGEAFKRVVFASTTGTHEAQVERRRMERHRSIFYPSGAT